MDEIWVDVPGWEHRYEVSNLGRVRSKDSLRGKQRGRMMTPCVSSRGYYKVRLTDGPRRAQGQVHRMVCEAFHGPAPEGKPWVLHRDGNALNNHADNLYWGDAFDNMKDAVEHGVHFYASKTHCPQGHPYSGDNLLKRDYRSSRECKTCNLSNARVRRSVNAMSGLEEGDPRHGTLHGYNSYRCRCEPCKEASQEYLKNRKSRRAPLPENDPRHGTSNGYVNWGCRCDLCWSAEKERLKRYGR